MKSCLTTLTVLLLSLSALVQAAERPKIALVLSGGGARGLAHIGVLKVLEEAKVPVDCVVGTSMGAIVGGAMATGMSADEMASIVSAADWEYMFGDKPHRKDVPYFRKRDDQQDYFDFTLTLKNFWPVPPRNLVGVHYISQFFRQMTKGIEVENFDQLPTPYRAIGADLETGKTVIMRHGDLPLVMRASMSVSGVFPPVPYENYLVVDGGIVKNMAIDEGRKLCGDVVIAVNVSSPNAQRQKLDSLFAVSEQTINIAVQKDMQAQIATLTAQDVLITPEMAKLSSTDFKESTKLMAAGEQAARTRLAQLQRYALTDVEYAQWQQQRQQRKAKTPHIQKVEIAPTRWVSPQVLKSVLAVPKGELLDIPALHQRIDEVYARGDFVRIGYQVKNQPDGATLKVIPVEKDGQDFARIGLKMNTDFANTSSFGLVAMLRRSWLNDLGAEWQVQGELGETRALYTEIYQPTVLNGAFFLAPWLQWKDEPKDLVINHETVGQHRILHAGGGIDIGSVIGKWGEVRMFVADQQVRWRSSLEVNNPSIGEHYEQIAYGIKAVFDQLDNPRFPRAGNWIKLDYTHADQDLGSDKAYQRLTLDWRRAFTWDDYTFFATGRGGTALGSTLPYAEEFQLGGALNLSAYRRAEFVGNNFFFTRLLGYKQIKDMPSALGGGIYVGLLAEAGATSQQDSWSSALLDNTVYSMGAVLAADTRLGPFYLTVAQGQQQRRAVHLTLGISY
ncbi:patatin-like phospholipase family protein [Agitococcus lubricus]|uniref:NTE family protein n=1 Tax=Agitococcus lubricus TaxID=1077255 RepID=A0A2T5IX09_9GAMM|nr:patatin-like phospholipase family protein [Agitococcus lubricus]PTQ88495.1 NTE family protein [Agitococcus lubricus]